MSNKKHSDLGPEHLPWLNPKDRVKGGCKWHHAGYTPAMDIFSGNAGRREQAIQARKKLIEARKAEAEKKTEQAK
jgi:hypothetical protein